MFSHMKTHLISGFICPFSLVGAWEVCYQHGIEPRSSAANVRFQLQTAELFTDIHKHSKHYTCS